MRIRLIAVALLSLAAAGCASTDEGPEPASDNSATSSSAATASTGDFSGTWVGRLDGRSSNIDDAEIRFSPAGHLLYEYRVRGGDVRSVEWATEGQQVQFIPPSGGVQTITIESLEREAGRVAITQRWAFEKSGSFLEQTYQVNRLEFELASSGLRMTMTTRTEEFMNGSPQGVEDEQYTGILTRK